MKLTYKCEEYPKLIHSSEDYEVQHVLIPEVTGDYFLAEIDSAGRYELLECVGIDEVQIEI